MVVGGAGSRGQRVNRVRPDERRLVQVWRALSCLGLRFDLVEGSVRGISWEALAKAGVTAVRCFGG